ncbi:MAG: MBL fold metallo-hydrolase [Clostridia bacterium]|nr:MBL fold metallo-hydrolase [Clostridia bacterium]
MTAVPECLLDLSDRDIEWIDLFDGGEPHRTSAYLVKAPRPAIIETGGSRARPRILAALEAAGIAKEDVAYVLVTHVHLDHAGGAGALARDLPNARIVVHPRGAPHLVDPTRLVEGTKQVHGPAAEELFGPVAPVPAERLYVPSDGEVIDLGGGHAIECIDTPGHALHHFAFYDRGARVLWPGDVMGIRYVPLSTAARPYVLPSTAPNQFDPDAMAASARRLAELPIDAVAFSHFGAARLDPRALAERVAEQARRYVEVARGAVDPMDDASVREALLAHVREDLARRGLAADPVAEAQLRFDARINAKGIVAYFQWLRKKAQAQG